MPFQTYLLNPYKTEIRALWCCTRTFDFFFKNFGTTLTVCFESLSSVQLHPSFYFLSLALIFLHTVLSSWWHLFSEVHQILLQQNTTQHHSATPVLQGWDRVPRLTSIPLFLIMAKQLHFSFTRTQNMSPVRLSKSNMDIRNQSVPSFKVPYTDPMVKNK